MCTESSCVCFSFLLIPLIKKQTLEDTVFVTYNSALRKVDGDGNDNNKEISLLLHIYMKTRQYL